MVEGSLGKATFALETDTAGFQRGLNKAQGMAKKSTASIGQNFQRMGGQLTAAGRGMTVAITAPIVGIGAAALKNFGDFDQAMTTSLAIMGDVSDSMRKDMSEAAREMALKTTFSAEQAAQSYFFLASAGLNAEQSLAAIGTVAAFAQAGQFDMALATDLLTDAQSALGLTVEDTTQNMENMTRVSDVLVKANTLANATVEQFSVALTTKAGAALAVANKSVEEGAGLLAFFADKGIKAARAGNLVTTMLTMLPTAAEKNADAFAANNIEVFDAQGNLKSFADIAREFTPLLENMSDAERAAAFAAMGLRRRVGQGIAVMKGGGDAIENYTDALGEAGDITQLIADKNLDSFNAQMSLMKSEVQDVFIVLGEQLAPVFHDLVKAMKPVLHAIKSGIVMFGKLPKPVKITIFALIALVATIGPILLIAGLLLTAIGGIIIALPLMAGGIAFVTGTLLPLLPVIALVVLALALIGFAIAAVIVNFDDIKRAGKGVLSFFANLAKGAIKFGAQLITGMAKGIARASAGLFRLVGRIVSKLITMLNPFKWVFGSLMVDVYGDAGEESGAALTQRLHIEAFKAKKQTTEDLQPDTKAIVEDFEETGEAAGEAVATGIASGIADSGLVDTIARAIDISGVVNESMRLPLEAMRGIVSDLVGELGRLSGLPTIESAAEDLEKAELALSQLEFKQQIEEGEDRIKQVDKEIRKLVDQRNMIVFLARGRTEGSDAIDKQLRSLVKEKKGIKKTIDVAEEKHDAIQSEIDALERLGETRELERDILAARAKAADKTLATDAEVLKQLGSMKETVGGVTAVLDEQVDDIHTQFIPAWNDVIKTLREAGAEGGGGAGAGEDLDELMNDLEELEDMDIDALIDDALGGMEDAVTEKIDSFKKFINDNLPIAGGAGVGAMIGFFFGGPVGALVGAGVGALIGMLVKKYQEPVIDFFKEAGDKILGFLEEWWQELATVLVLLIAAPLAPIVLLATDAFGIRTALFNAFKSIFKFTKKIWKKIKDFFTGLWDDITGFVTDTVTGIFKTITGAFNDVLNWLKTNWAGIIAEIILAPFFFLRVGADDLWGIRTAMWNGLQAVIGFVKDAFNTIKDFIISTLTTLPGLVLSLALSIGTTIFEGVIQGLGFLLEIRSRIVGVLEGILSAIPGIALSIGKAMFDGIVSGLGDIAEAVWSKIPSPLQWLIKQLSLGIDIAGELASQVPGAGIVGDVAGAVTDPVGTLTGFFKQRGAFEIKGRGTKDTEPRMLAPGEMVLPRDSAQVLRDFFTGGGERQGGRDINVTVHNPQPEAAEDTLRRRLQALAQLGVTE